MTESEALKLMESLQISHDCEMVKTLDFKATVIKALEDLRQYRAIGTVEEIQQKLAELDRWHTSKVNEKIKNPFAYTSTSICHNCDHKDEYIEELEVELEECRTAVEKMKPKSPVDVMEDYGTFECPSCGGLIYTEDSLETHKYCLLCGQHLSW